MDRKGKKQTREKSLAISVACMASDLLQALKGERLSSVFSPDGTLISASAAPHCGKGGGGGGRRGVTGRGSEVIAKQ